MPPSNKEAVSWVGPELGVTTYRICRKINIHKRVYKHTEKIVWEADYKVITQLCFPPSPSLCDSSLIVPQNTSDTKPDTRAIQCFKCYSLQPTENSIHPWPQKRERLFSFLSPCLFFRIRAFAGRSSHQTSGL